MATVKNRKNEIYIINDYYEILEEHKKNGSSWKWEDNGVYFLSDEAQLERENPYQENIYNEELNKWELKPIDNMAQEEYEIKVKEFLEWRKREERNTELQKSDVELLRRLEEKVLSEDLQTKELREYRQALRDITELENFETIELPKREDFERRIGKQ